MAKKKFFNEGDLTEENLEEFWREIDALEEKAAKHSRLLRESTPPQFNSIEEARKYYNAMSFAEWENDMREKYNIDDRTKAFLRNEKERKDNN